MRMDELKRGLWGYKKDSVYHYIVSMDAKASARLAEKDARLEKVEEDAKRQIGELEAVIKALREENAALRENQATVFSTMLEAQKYAEQLRADSDRQMQQFQRQFAAAIQQKNQQLEHYLEQIHQLRTMIREVLKDFDGRLEDAGHALGSLPAQAPAAVLDLDPKGTAQGEVWKRTPHYIAGGIGRTGSNGAEGTQKICPFPADVPKPVREDSPGDPALV